MRDLGWTPDTFWNSSLLDLVAAMNAKYGQEMIDLTGLDESAKLIEEKLRKEESGRNESRKSDSKA